jgi:hypothetical protein
MPMLIRLNPHRSHASRLSEVTSSGFTSIVASRMGSDMLNEECSAEERFGLKKEP